MITLTQEGIDIEEGIETLQEMDSSVSKQYIDDMTPKLLNLAVEVVLAILLYLVGKQVIKLIRKIVRKSLERHDADVGVRQFLDSVIKYALYFLLWLMILTLFGVTTASVIAVLGSAGLTLGLALQGSLANFAGGVLILLMRPFKVGDYIMVGGNEGTVKEISTFYTKISTLDNRMVLLPNGQLTDSAIVNVTGQAQRRLDLKVGIAYDADLFLAKKTLEELVEEEPRRLSAFPDKVYVSELGESSVDLGCFFWVKTEDYWEVRWGMLEKIKLAFDAQGIQIPFPQLDVHLQQQISE